MIFDLVVHSWDLARGISADDTLDPGLVEAVYASIEPDTDLTAEYNFFENANGARRLFNRTPPQHLTDNDLPQPEPWQTQAFTSQSVSLHSFPPGQYELEVTVRDRLTRSMAKEAVAFTVK